MGSPDGEAGPAATVPAAEAFAIAPVPSAGRTDMAAAVDNAAPCARTKAARSGLAIATIATILTILIATVPMPTVPMVTVPMATVLIATGGAVAAFSRPTRRLRRNKAMPERYTNHIAEKRLSHNVASGNASTS